MIKLSAYSNGIYRLDAEYIEDEIAAVYFIVEGHDVAIIEVTSSHCVPLILAALAQLQFKPEHVKYIIPTHIHLDHTSGCGSLLQHCPNATVLVDPRGLKHLIDPSKLIAGASAVYGEQKLKDLYGDIIPIDKNRIRAQNHQTSVFLGQRELYFIHTEGHAKHHFCILDKVSQSIFAGDTFGLSYPALNALSSTNKNFIVIPTTTPIHFDPKALKQSIAIILALKPNSIYLTHFGPVDHIESAYCQLLFWISYYGGLAHNAVKDKNASEDYFYQSILKTTQDIYAASHALSSNDIEAYLAYDLHLNAQGLYHYSQTL